MLIHLLSRNNFLYSTQRLFQACVKAGHEVEIFDYCGLNVIYKQQRPTLYFQHEHVQVPDIVIGRISPTYTPLGTALLAQHQQLGCYCSPTDTGLLLARNKWRAIGALRGDSIQTPRSAMLSDLSQLDELVPMLGGFPLVIKLLESTHGSGVMIAPDLQSARSILDAFAGLHKGVLVQEYIAESKGADVRVIVCGERVVAAMTRTPAAGEFRSNLHRGGNPLQATLSDEERRVAIQATAAVGLRVAGVDFLRSNRGPLVMEVNASPGLEGIEAATGIDVAGAIIEQVVADAKKPRS